MTKIIYRSADNMRYFHAPSNVTQTSGVFAIRTLRGEEFSVDPAAIAPYEIPRAEAETLIRAEVQHGLAQFGTLMKLKAQERSAERAASQKKVQAGVKALIGFNSAELQANPEVAAQNTEQLNAFFEGLKEVISGATSTDAAALQAAQERMQFFKAQLASADIEMSAALETLPEALYVAANSVERQQKLKQTAAGLQSLRAQLPEVLEQLGQALQEKAQEMQAQADQIALTDTPSSP